MNLRELFQKTIEELRRHPRVKLLHNWWNPITLNEPAVKLMVHHVQDRFHETLPQELIELSEVANNTHICWQAQADGRACGGEFFLKGLAELYNAPFVGLRVTDSIGAPLQPSPEISIFDEHPEFGDGHLALLRRQEVKHRNSLWFYQNGYAYSLHLTYREYLTRLCETRGIAWWQLFFCEFSQDKDNAELHGHRLNQALKALQSLFPATDFSYYQAVLDRMNLPPSH